MITSSRSVSGRVVLITLLIMKLCHQPGAGQGQRISFDYLGPQHGLSQNSILCMLEDQQGFIWFGTEDGLNRFDGYDFKIYSKDLKDSSSISYGIIWHIYEDNQERFWVGTRGGGLNLFDKKQDRFYRYQHHPDDPNSISHDIVRAVMEDRDGHIWVGTDYGLNRLKFKGPKTVEFEKFFHNQDDATTLSDDYIGTLYKDSHGDLWIGTNKGLNKYQQGKFKRYLLPDAGERDSNIINKILEDREGNFWLCTFAGLYLFDRDREQFTNISAIPAINIFSVAADLNGNLWVGTEDQGLFIYNPSSSTVRHLKKDPNDPKSLTDDWIRDLLIDRSGIVWVGTYAGSINRYDPHKYKFKHFTSDPNDPNSLNNEILWEIYEDKQGIIWLGTFRGGLNRFEPVTGRFTHFVHDPNEPRSLSHNDVRAVLKDSRGDVWVATWGGGLNKMIEDKSGVWFKHYRSGNQSNSISNDRAWVLYEDRNGYIWIGTNGGVDRFDPVTGKFTNYAHDPDDPGSISNNSVRSIGEDRRGFIWFGTFNGMNRFNPQTDEFISYRHTPGKEVGIINNFVHGFHFDSDETLWIGTRSGFTKMTKLYSDQPVFKNFTEEHGLPNNVVYGILEDDQGYLWMPTNKGLSRFNKQTEEFRNFTEADGLQNDEFNWGAQYRAGDGTLLVGGINGFNAFKAEDIQDNSYLPPVFITEFNVLNERSSVTSRNSKNRSIYQDAFPFASGVELSHKDYFFSFEFAALNYTQSQNNQYKYKLEGFDEEWIDAGNRRFATYTNIDPGEYEFKVKASNNDGIWNEEAAAVLVTILPPWWATWWAYMLYGVMALGLIWGYFNYRENVHKGKMMQQEAELRAETAEAQAKAISIESKAKIERVKTEERDKLREQNSRDFHDELGHKLTKISMFLELAKRAEGKQNDLNKYLSKVEENTKDLSGGMRDFIWVLDPRKDTLYDVVIRLKDFGDHLFDHSGVSFKLEGLVDGLKEQGINSDTRRDLVLLFKEAMNNALKYSSCQNAVLSIDLSTTGYAFTFSDDGQGFDENTITRGYGLKNMRSRAEKLGRELIISSSPGQGTIVKLSVKN